MVLKTLGTLKVKINLIIKIIGKISKAKYISEELKTEIEKTALLQRAPLFLKYRAKKWLDFYLFYT